MPNDIGTDVAILLAEGVRPSAHELVIRPSELEEETPVYQKPTVEKFGSFRELTHWGFSSASDGGSILGVTVSIGCSTTWEGQTYNFGCPTGPTTS